LRYYFVFYLLKFIEGAIFTVNFQIHRYPLLVQEHHLDSFGHMNNATYLQILEQARWDMITQRGYGYKEIQATGLGPTILEIHMKFLKELHLRDEVTIETQALSYNKKIGYVRQQINHASRGLCFEATLTFGLFDIHKRKLVTATSQWLKALGIDPKDYAGQENQS
jgi:acyl-CoA thioester hydrolase